LVGAALVLCAGSLVAAVAGCSSGGPTEQELRAALVEAIHKDNQRYNQRMNRYGDPKPEIDGSSFSMVRSRRKLAVRPSGIEIRETGGRTTVYEAEVPIAIQTHIKTGVTERECMEAPERKLEPQRVSSRYTYDVVRHEWHEAKSRGGSLLGSE